MKHAALSAIAAALLLLVIAATFWYLTRMNAPQQEAIVAAEADVTSSAPTTSTTFVADKNENVFVGTIAPTSTQTYTNSQFGVKFRVPADWKITVESIPGSNSYVRAVSPDYTEKELGKDELQMGSNPGATIVGSSLQIFTPEDKLSDSIKTPRAYVDFEMSFLPDCSNCLLVQEIVLHDRPAVLTVTTYDNGVGQSVHLTTTHEGKAFSLTFTYAHDTAETRGILNEFIKSFEFM